MFWFKGCRRCQGDLYMSEDPYGVYVSCLQCSHYLTETEEAGLLGSARDLAGLSKSYARLGNLTA